MSSNFTDGNVATKLGYTGPMGQNQLVRGNNGGISTIMTAKVPSQISDFPLENQLNIFRIAWTV
jgi:hypothetical protein